MTPAGTSSSTTACASSSTRSATCPSSTSSPASTSAPRTRPRRRAASSTSSSTASSSAGRRRGPGPQVGADIRRHGAYFNGTTGQDLSVFEISLPSEHAAFALRQPEGHPLRARPEPGRARGREGGHPRGARPDGGRPGQRSAADRVLQELFAGHPLRTRVRLRRPRQSSPAATVEGLLGLYRKRFVTAGNAALAVVGDFATADMERLVREVFGALPSDRARAAADLAHGRGRPGRTPSVGSSATSEDGYRSIWPSRPRTTTIADRYATRVLVEALGRGVNPLLSDPPEGRARHRPAGLHGLPGLPLRRRRRHPYQGRALRTWPAVEQAALAFLQRPGGEDYSKKDFLDPEAELAAFDFLESAKNQIPLRRAQAEESGLRLAGSFVRHILLNTREKPGRYLDEIGQRRIGGPAAGGRQVPPPPPYFGRADHVLVTVAPRRGAPVSFPVPDGGPRPFSCALVQAFVPAAASAPREDGPGLGHPPRLPTGRSLRRDGRRLGRPRRTGRRAPGSRRPGHADDAAGPGDPRRGEGRGPHGPGDPDELRLRRGLLGRRHRMPVREPRRGPEGRRPDRDLSPPLGPADLAGRRPCPSTPGRKRTTPPRPRHAAAMTGFSECRSVGSALYGTEESRKAIDRKDVQALLPPPLRPPVRVLHGRLGPRSNDRSAGPARRYFTGFPDAGPPAVPAAPPGPPRERDIRLSRDTETGLRRPRLPPAGPVGRRPRPRRPRRTALGRGPGSRLWRLRAEESWPTRSTRA
ncbi:MAG: hypothetical protein MZV70_66525 [Desulfobacterales bacterium]|nr:hypothetical protein [Desulfobacterales bacterium]